MSENNSCWFDPKAEQTTGQTKPVRDRLAKETKAERCGVEAQQRVSIKYRN